MEEAKAAKTKQEEEEAKAAQKEAKNELKN